MLKHVGADLEVGPYNDVCESGFVSRFSASLRCAITSVATIRDLTVICFARDRRQRRAGRRASLHAASASSSCASHAAIMPVRTSPVPPVAMPGLPVGLMNTFSSGVAISVRCPLRTT